MTTAAGPVLLGLVLLVAGCGQAGAPTGAAPVTEASAADVVAVQARHLVPDGYDGAYRGTGLVLEAPGVGPQLCLGAVNESWPPQCGGPVVEGWDWDAVPAGSYETATGIRWGPYSVTGDYDGARFVMTQPAGLPEPPDSPPESPDFSAPCSEPEGGWSSSEADVARQQEDLQAAADLAPGVQGYGALWLDRRESVVAGVATAAPSDMVLVVTTAGDLDEMSKQVGTVWDGALCVAPALRTAVELTRVQQEVSQLPGLLSSGSDPTRSVVEVSVLLATQAQQDDLDATYGPGVVELSGALEPVQR